MKNQDQVLIDGLLENHVGLAFVWERRTWEILPWLSFNLLISRLSTSLCMVSGRCCISLKTKSWREDSYCVKKKNKKKKQQKLFIGLISYEWILAEEAQTRSTHWGCGLNSPPTPPMFRWADRACVCWLIRHGSLSTAKKRAKTVRHATQLGPLLWWLDWLLDYHEEH